MVFNDVSCIVYVCAALRMAIIATLLTAEFYTQLQRVRVCGNGCVQKCDRISDPKDLPMLFYTVDQNDPNHATISRHDMACGYVA